MTDRPTPPGPLRLPASPPHPAATKTVREKLRGHSTAANWLPEGLWPELDALRAEQLRLRGQVVAELSSVEGLAARFRSEDKEHEDQLRQAHREGRPESTMDRRTSPEQRLAERAAVEERLWAGVMVLGEMAEAVIAAVREHEDEWLTDLRQRLEPAREKRRKVERLLAEAKAEEWRVHRLGQWLQITSEDGAFGRQPAPIPSPPPAQFSEEVLRGSLEVPWHRDRPWKGEGEKPLRSWMAVSEADQVATPPDPDEDAPSSSPDPTQATGDPTGRVSELV